MVIMNRLDMSCFLRTRKHFEKTENREFMIENGKILVEKLVAVAMVNLILSVASQSESSR